MENNYCSAVYREGLLTAKLNSQGWVGWWRVVEHQRLHEMRAERRRQELCAGVTEGKCLVRKGCPAVGVTS